MNYSTNRLTLRPIGIDDVDAMLSTRTMPEIVAFTYEPIWTRSYAEERIREWIQMQRSDNPSFTRWIVERKDEPGAIGDVFIRKDDELQGSAEIGYVIHPDFAGKGFATEAVSALLRIGIREWKVHRIFARVDEDNIGSVKVCQKLGMRQEARLIENDKRGDVWSTELIFAMLDREWMDAVGR